MPDECTNECISGCECPPGTFIQEGMCVEASECQCEYNGKRYNNTATMQIECNKW